MTSTFRCESCDSIFPLGATRPAGSAVKCPMCGAMTTIAADLSKPPPEKKPADKPPIIAASPPPASPAAGHTPGSKMPSAADILQSYMPKKSAPTSPGTRPKPSPAPPTNQGTTRRPTLDSGPGQKPPAPGAIKKASLTHPGTTRRPDLPGPDAPGEQQATIDKDTRHEINVDAPASGAPPNAAEPTASAGEAEKIRVVCPGCNTRIKFPASLAPGTTIKCPRCGQRVQTPAADAPPTEPAKSTEPATNKPAASKTPATESAAREPAPVSPAASSRPAPVPALSIESIAEASLPPPAPVKETVWATPADLEAQAEQLARRRRQLRLAAGIGLVLVLAFVVYRLVRPESTPRGIAGPEPIALTDWQQFTPANANFTVLLPGEPTLIPLQPNAGKPPQTKEYRVDRPDKEAAFLLSFVNLPRSSLDRQQFDELYRQQRDELIERRAGRIRLETNRSWKGHYGREFQITTAEGHTVIQRMFLVEEPDAVWLYVLQATVTGKNGPSMAARYLDSLLLPDRNDPSRG